jgi:hypothetical protein
MSITRFASHYAARNRVLQIPLDGSAHGTCPKRLVVAFADEKFHRVRPDLDYMTQGAQALSFTSD